MASAGYRLKPSRLAGIVLPQTPPVGGIPFETYFWLLASTFGSDVSVQGITYSFLVENKGFFSAMQRLGFSISSHSYGCDFCGSYENSVVLQASALGPCLPLIAIAACSGFELFTAEIDDPRFREDAACTARILSALHVGSEMSEDRLRIFPKGKVDGGQPVANGAAAGFMLALASLISDEHIVIAHPEDMEKASPGFFRRLAEHTKEKW
ncbi:MAG: hypothetical protein LBC69_03800 [Eubacteriaceae bacterium]|jgi:5-enolpyruvylshikimate-3-phosphate synthase|nr:hypothetical protein [Eubacteriaceae bacterium]